MKRLVAAALLTFAPAVARADSFLGAFFAAGMADRFPRDKALAMLSTAEYPVLAVLWKFGGRNPQIFRDFIAQSADRPHLIYIYLSNETDSCRSVPTRCTPDDLLPGVGRSLYSSLLKIRHVVAEGFIRQRVREIVNTIQPLRGPNTGAVLVMGLEDKLPRDAAVQLSEILREELPPDWFLARNPADRRLIRADAEVFELHTVSPRSLPQGAVLSEDGVDGQSYSDTRRFFRRFRKRSVALLAWRGRWQGRNTRQPLPVDLRTFTITDSDVRNFSRIFATAR